MNSRSCCRSWLRFVVVIFCSQCCSWSAIAADDAESLRSIDNKLAQQLANNQFQRQLVINSTESPDTLKGDVYAELNYPFTTVNAALNDPVKGPGNWCDILILPPNTKYCHASVGSNGAVINLNIGQKVEQELSSTDRMQFRYHANASKSDYFKVDLDAESGPLGTRDYHITLEAVAIKGNRTFLHLSYDYSYGMVGRVAMKSYLATIGSRKVGFTRSDAKSSSSAKYIGGVRGMVERNAMRYYLAIDAYLAALSSSPGAQFEQRLTKWFDAAEQYPRQLHEIERKDYLLMKRKEYKRQQTMQ